MVKSVADFLDTLNYFLTRTKPYNPAGRLQKESESDNLNEPMLELLKMYDVNFKTVTGNLSGYNQIITDILSKLEERNGR